MAPEDGQEKQSLTRRLEEAPWEFDFFQAVRRLECESESRANLGESVRPSEERLRLSQDPHLTFSPAGIGRFRAGGPDGLHRMFVRFMGLLGPNGPMPLRMSEYVQDQIEHHKDETLARFLDVFHHRMISFFYLAWSRNQKPVQYENKDRDRFATYIASFVGAGMPRLRDRDALPDNARLFYSGLMAGRTKPAAGLTQCLRDYFGVPVELVQFVGEWIPMPKADQCRLGSSPENAALGQTAVVGERVWDCQHTFRIQMGPLDYEQFLSLLPGGESLRVLRAWVKSYAGLEMKCQLQLVLKAEEAPETKLGSRGRLGWSTWVRKEPLQEDSGDVMLDLLSTESEE